MKFDEIISFTPSRRDKKKKLVIAGIASIDGEQKLLNHFYDSPEPFTMWIVRSVNTDQKDFSEYRVYSELDGSYVNLDTPDMKRRMDFNLKFYKQNNDSNEKI